MQKCKKNTNNQTLYKIFQDVSELKQTVTSYLEHAILEKFPNFGQILIKGVLKLGYCGEKFQFASLRGKDEEIVLYIPKVFFQEKEVDRSKLDRQPVEVRGRLKFNKSKKSSEIQYHIHVDFIRTIEPQNNIELHERQRELFLHDILKKYPLQNRFLSFDGFFHVLATKTAYADFELALPEEIKNKVSFTEVNFSDINSLCQKINTVQADVVILLRGGGDDATFEIFNDLLLLECWAKKDSYKILGIGHSSNRGYFLEIYSHHIASTPSDAGNFIAQQYKEHNCLEILQKEKENILAQKQKIDSQIHFLKKQLEDNNREFIVLQTKMSEKHKEIEKTKALLYKSEGQLKEKDQIINQLKNERAQLIVELENEKRIRQDENNNKLLRDEALNNKIKTLEEEIKNQKVSEERLKRKLALLTRGLWCSWIIFVIILLLLVWFNKQ